MDADSTTTIVYISAFAVAIASLEHLIEVCSLWPSLRIKLISLKLWLQWRRISSDRKQDGKQDALIETTFCSLYTVALIIPEPAAKCDRARKYILTTMRGLGPGLYLPTYVTLRSLEVALVDQQGVLYAPWLKSVPMMRFENQELNPHLDHHL